MEELLYKIIAECEEYMDKSIEMNMVVYDELWDALRCVQLSAAECVLFEKEGNEKFYQMDDVKKNCKIYEIIEQICEGEIANEIT